MILCISSCINSTHLKDGSSNLLICLLTKSSNETSGTKSAGRGPFAFLQKKRQLTSFILLPSTHLIAVKISIFVRPANGCMESKVLPNVSWKI